MLALWVPVVAYWIYSIFFHFIMKAELPLFEKYRIHTVSDLEKRNRVSVSRVLSMVLLQQLIQTVLGVLVLHPIDPISTATSEENSLKWFTGIILQLQSTLFGQQHLQSAIYLSQFIYWAVIPTLQFMGGM
jgi:sphinganine C4-monooxygenase